MGSTAGLRQIEMEWAGHKRREKDEGDGGQKGESRKAAETTTRKWKSFMRGRDKARTGKRKTNKAKWRGLKRDTGREEVKEIEKVREKGGRDAEARLYTNIREIETVFFIFPES